MVWVVGAKRCPPPPPPSPRAPPPFVYPLSQIFLYNLTTNFTQGLVVFFSFVIGLKEMPLTPIQVL
jgi:hypothetical protein